MLIDEGKRYNAIFREVIEDCIVDKITKEQALVLIQSRYKTELEKIKINEKNNPDVFHIIDIKGKLYSVQKNAMPINRDTGKKINLLELYKKNIREFEDYYNDCIAEIESLPDKQNSEPTQNKLINKMIEEGILTKDGKRPVKNLDDIACFLVDEGQNVTVMALENLGLTQRNGKPYSKRAYQKAVNKANIEHYAKKVHK